MRFVRPTGRAHHSAGLCGHTLARSLVDILRNKRDSGSVDATSAVCRELASRQNQTRAPLRSCQVLASGSVCSRNSQRAALCVCKASCCCCCRCCCVASERNSLSRLMSRVSPCVCVCVRARYWLVARATTMTTSLGVIVELQLLLLLLLLWRPLATRAVASQQQQQRQRQGSCGRRATQLDVVGWPQQTAASHVIRWQHFRARTRPLNKTHERR